MKKVRFESPLKSYKVFEMNENECHFPRPFIERQVSSVPRLPMYDNARPVPYNPDPVHRHDYGNSSPFPNVCKMQVNNAVDLKTKIAPTNDLELSILDATNSENKMCTPQQMHNRVYSRKPLTEVNKQLNENTNDGLIPNVLSRPDDFFLRKENLSKINSQDAFYNQLNKLSLGKENSPQSMKMELVNKLRHDSQLPTGKNIVPNNNGNCCQFRYQSCMQSSTPHPMYRNHCVQNASPCHVPDMQNYYNQPCHCQKQICPSQTPPKSTQRVPENFVDKRNWVVEKLDQTNKECAPINSLDDKVKREPTVSDLFKIIKLQNEQLQMLQQKVDTLISEKQEPKPVAQYITSHVALQAVEEQKMSIGVMTSFEMVRTSTIINKEIVTQNEAQIQCNRSQISVKEVVSKCQPNAINFLDGIPARNNKEAKTDIQETSRNMTKDTECVGDDKTYNEMSLYNVQVDNATTPNMSPEQSLYLDVRDYSDSDSGSDEQSNVGWTYYNKVMTHVNGLLHESDMPSSASALYRNARQTCLQMQIDKTNVSVAKRVTFGDDPLGMQQQNLNAAMTDTSLKMNQLAAKYLKSRPVFTKSPSPKPLTAGPNEMSYATRNYMEKHKLLQGTQTYKLGMEIPKFLDITALKQQPKLV